MKNNSIINSDAKEISIKSNNKSSLLTAEEYNERIKNLKSLSDVTGFFREILAPTIQSMLEAEMDNHLGYSKHHSSGKLSGNNRNGYYKKNIKTDLGGQVQVNIPRDRNGEFEPVVVRKYETVESDIEEKIISMYAKGLSTRDIENHMHDIYGIAVSADMVSSITDKVMPLVKEWQERPLTSQYAIVYMDVVHFKVRENGKIISKEAYIMLGINMVGLKEILGIWVGENEGAKHWLRVINEIKSRGVNDILIACVDGLKGFSDAIKTVFPNTEIQQCIVHQIRNTVKYVSHADRKKFCADLKNVYQALNEEAALENLEIMKKNWSQYAIYLESWEKKWDELSVFFAYPEEIRRIIYTTNAIEGLNRQFRKVTKTTSIFPHDGSLIKLLWLAQNDITKKWTLPIRNWGKIIAQFALMFPDRINL